MFQRLAILALGIFSVWLIVFVVFERVDQKMPWVLAASVTYGIGAYLILPRIVWMGTKLIGHTHVPRFTLTGDGLPGDPVNLVLIGTFDQLRRAFASAGWVEADKLSIANSIRMTRAFLFNTPYPTAPFSTLRLFGRGQDIGFQKPIDNSPRKRHHVRFWALCLGFDRDAISSVDFWLNADRPAFDQKVIWVGAGTCDTGFGLTRLTFKITHATDSDTNAERDFILQELRTAGAIGQHRLHQTGDRLITEHVNHYTTDGEIGVADLIDKAKG